MIEDILESAYKILRYTSGMTFDQFSADDRTVDAVARNFEIIGEAANRLSPEFKANHQDIEWDRHAGLETKSFTIISVSTMPSFGQ